MIKQSKVIGLVLMLVLFCVKTNAQYASIQNTNMQIYGVLNNQKVGYTTTNYQIKLNKETGTFEIKIAVDDLIISDRPEEYKRDSTLNEGKFMIFSGTFPIKEVLGRDISTFDIQVPVEIKFNDIYDETYFTVQIFLMANGGFNVIGKGTINHQTLQIENLENFEDELVINFNFVGY